MVVWLFLAVPWACLQFVIVVYPDHTHLLFLNQRLLDLKSTLTQISIGVRNNFYIQIVIALEISSLEIGEQVIY